MLERVDRMQLVVRDRAEAADNFARLLGAALLHEAHSDYLNADRTIMALGESEVELCEPAGPGLAEDFLERRGEGLLNAGYATSRPDALYSHLRELGVQVHLEQDQMYLPASETMGFPMVISELKQRPRIGPVSFFYEATHSLDSDWQAAKARHMELFQLDDTRFSDIGSERWGYVGTLTLFDPPARLDRIELSQALPGTGSSMRRFVERHGDSLYMCYVETHDFIGLRDRLLAGGAHVTPREGAIEDETDGMWVHPKSLHGLLLGISRTTVAWQWSGRPELVQPAA